MNAQDPLAALHPLREPPQIDAWPPAPGWWLVAALVLAGVLALALLLVRRYRANAYRRRAERQLRDAHARLAASGDAARFLEETNALLKGVALEVYPRRQVAACHGAQWERFLRDSAGPGADFDAGFTEAVYDPTHSVDCEQLQRAALHWIRHHRVAA